LRHRYREIYTENEDEFLGKLNVLQVRRRDASFPYEPVKRGLSFQPAMRPHIGKFSLASRGNSFVAEEIQADVSF